MITGIDVNVLQNIPLKVISRGSDAYIIEVAKILSLTNENVR
jgi:hypothetical protein